MNKNKNINDQILDHMLQLFDEIEQLRSKIKTQRAKNVEFEIIQSLMSHLRAQSVKLNTLIKMSNTLKVFGLN